MVWGAAEDEALGFEGLVGDGEGLGGGLVEIVEEVGRPTKEVGWPTK